MHSLVFAPVGDTMSTEEKSVKQDEKPVDDQRESSERAEDALRMTPAEERKLLRRIDLWIVPYASLLVSLLHTSQALIGCS